MEIGRVLDNTYEILEQIGDGGGGIIFKAYHRRLKKDVILKKIKYSSASDEKEKEILKNLKLAYLPQVYDFLDITEGVFTVMEYIPGISFDQALKAGQVFSAQQVIKYAEQLCEAVDYLHKQNPPIIHGDIKPANIMLTPQDNICLIDFNISGVLDGNAMATTGFSVGYAAPEQARAFMYEKEKMSRNSAGGKDGETEILSESVSKYEFSTNSNASIGIDCKADIYSVAATLYHILTGIRPDSNPDKIVSPNKLDKKNSDAISNIIMKGLSGNPASRFDTAEQMLLAFRNVYSYDAGYKKLKVKQCIFSIVSSLAVLSGAALIILGVTLSSDNKSAMYNSKLASMERSIYDGASYDDIQRSFKELNSIRENDVSGYAMVALWYYQNRMYDDCIEYIDAEILSRTSLGRQKEISDVYFILANCYYEKGNYEESLTYYEEALKNDQTSIDCYGYYASALIMEGKIDKAQLVISDAEKKGMPDEEVFLLQGEMYSVRDEFDKAEESLNECILCSESDEILVRAYVAMDKLLRKKGIEGIEKSVLILTEGCEKISDVNRVLLLKEKIAQNYIDLYNETSDGNYCNKAIEVLKDIQSKSIVKSKTTNETLIVMYLNVMKLEDAIALSQEMIDAYPEDYSGYKYRALAELILQSNKIEGRDLQAFCDYYEKAAGMYSLSNNYGTDSEMQMLETYYNQIY